MAFYQWLFERVRSQSTLFVVNTGTFGSGCTVTDSLAAGSGLSAMGSSLIRSSCSVASFVRLGSCVSVATTTVCGGSLSASPAGLLRQCKTLHDRLLEIIFVLFTHSPRASETTVAKFKLISNRRHCVRKLSHGNLSVCFYYRGRANQR